MERYDYRKVIRDDIREYVEDFIERKDGEIQWQDVLIEVDEELPEEFEPEGDEEFWDDDVEYDDDDDDLFHDICMSWMTRGNK